MLIVLQMDWVRCLLQRLVLQELYVPGMAAARSGGPAQQQGSLLLTGVLNPSCSWHTCLVVGADAQAAAHSSSGTDADG